MQLPISLLAFFLTLPIHPAGFLSDSSYSHASPPPGPISDSSPLLTLFLRLPIHLPIPLLASLLTLRIHLPVLLLAFLLTLPIRLPIPSPLGLPFESSYSRAGPPLGLNIKNRYA